MSNDTRVCPNCPNCIPPLGNGSAGIYASRYTQEKKVKCLLLDEWVDHNHAKECPLFGQVARLPEFIGLEQLCRETGFKHSTMRLWVNEGIIPGYKIKGAWYFLRGEVLIAIREKPILAETSKD